MKFRRLALLLSLALCLGLWGALMPQQAEAKQVYDVDISGEEVLGTHTISGRQFCYGCYTWTYPSEMTYSQNYHWWTCPFYSCGEANVYTHEAYCDSPDTCYDCGASGEVCVIVNVEHVWDDCILITDETYHYYKCAGCDEISSSKEKRHLSFYKKASADCSR